MAPLCLARYVPYLNLSGREKAFPILGVKFAGNRGNGYLKFAGEQKTVFSQQKQYVYDGDDLGILCPRGASLGFRRSVLP